MTCTKTSTHGPVLLSDIILTIRGGRNDYERYREFMRWYRGEGCCKFRLFNGFSNDELGCTQSTFSYALNDARDPNPWAFTIIFPIEDANTAVWFLLKFT